MDSFLSGELLPLVALCLAAALLVPLVAERLRLPAPITLLAVGLGIGSLPLPIPAGYGALISSIGLTYAFFVAGCEVEVRRLALLSPKSALFALGAFASALGLGWLVGTRFLGLPTIDSLILGAVFSAAGTLPKRFAERIARLEVRGGTSMLAANDLGEVLRILAFLALLAPRVPEIRLDIAGLVTLPTLAWLLGGTVLGFLVLAFIAARWFGRGEASANLGFSLLAAICFGAAAFAGSMGLAPALGAMVAGIAVGRAAPSGSLLSERLAFGSRSLFLPLALVPFGIALGSSLDPGAASKAGILVPAIASAAALAFIPRLFGVLLVLPGFAPRHWRGLFALALASGKESPTLLCLLLAIGLGALGPVAGIFALALLPLLWLRKALSDPEAIDDRGDGRAALAMPRPRLPGRKAEATGGSCIVGLANPGTAPELLSLAFLLRSRSSTVAVRPLVVCESADGERELERAEYLLAQAIVAARDANVPLEPATLTASTVAEGILGAALERPTSCIVVGWNRAPHAYGAFSAGILESLLGQTDAIVVAVRPAGGFAGIDRLVLALPPGVESRPEAALAAGAIASLLAATGAGLSVLVQRSGSSAARSLLATAKGRGGLELHELESWKQAARAAKALAREGREHRTGYAILAGRPGSADWHPSFESMPRDFALAFPDSPLMVVHYPGGDSAREEVAMPRGLYDEALARGRVLAAMEEAAITDALRRLLATAWAEDRRSLSQLTALFTGIAQKEAIELEPGVILLHAHVPDIEAPLVFFGARPEGWRLIALDEPVKILVVLCAPESQRPEQHLATLGELARLFKDGALGSRLSLARGPSDLQSAAYAPGPAPTSTPSTSMPASVSPSSSSEVEP
jgi:Kef-type K+ transport system membrane component KefB/mannitol/fructose-specific phosphotransferase system IIA component (Ntr-type)